MITTLLTVIEHPLFAKNGKIELRDSNKNNKSRSADIVCGIRTHLPTALHVFFVLSVERHILSTAIVSCNGTFTLDTSLSVFLLLALLQQYLQFC